MPFRSTFECLWCGAAHTVRTSDDLEGWAQLCPTCVGNAGGNGFLRFRLRQALIERGAASAAREGPEAIAASTPALEAPATGAPGAEPAHAAAQPAKGPAEDLGREMIDYYEARAGEYDDWYLRRGRYERGPIHDAAWAAELDAAGRWLDALPIAGEIVELAAGTGWWSPLLASKGELSLYDAAPATLDRARERLVAHRLRAHLHVRDAWDEPDREVDALFTGFWLSHVPASRLDEFLGLARRWLKAGAIFAFIDSLADPQSGAADNPSPGDGIAVRRLADGREFRVVKEFHSPGELNAALLRAGFAAVEVSTTGRFFLLGVARV